MGETSCVKNRSASGPGPQSQHRAQIDLEGSTAPMCIVASVGHHYAQPALSDVCVSFPLRRSSTLRLPLIPLRVPGLPHCSSYSRAAAFGSSTREDEEAAGSMQWLYTIPPNFESEKDKI